MHKYKNKKFGGIVHQTVVCWMQYRNLHKVNSKITYNDKNSLGGKVYFYGKLYITVFCFKNRVKYVKNIKKEVLMRNVFTTPTWKHRKGRIFILSINRSRKPKFGRENSNQGKSCSSPSNDLRWVPKAVRCLPR